MFPALVSKRTTGASAAAALMQAHNRQANKPFRMTSLLVFVLWVRIRHQGPAGKLAPWR